MLKLKNALVLALLSISATAEASDQIYIPTKTKTAQAIDILDTSDPAGRRTIDRSRLAQMHMNGTDISAMDPAPNDVWTPNSLSITNEDQFSYPPEESTFTYLSKMRASGQFRAQVEHNGRPFRIVIDMDNHQAHATAALLRRLGYNQDSPKDYRKLTVSFKSKADYDDFFYYMGLNTRFAKKRWVVSEDEANLKVVLQDVTIEYPRIENTQYYWGRASGNWLAGRRAARALIVPLSLLDIRLSERSVNLYSWELGRVLSNNIVLEHPYATAFQETTYEDAKWIARKIAKLTEADFRLILERENRLSNDHAGYPDEINSVLLRKIISRRNQLVTLFGLQNEPGIVAKIQPSIGVVNTACVKKDEVQCEYFDGYAARFTVGDPQSPLRWSELKHYIKMELISQAIAVATSYMNKELQIHTVEEAQDNVTKKFIENVAKACAEQAQTNPGEPCRYVVPLKAWAQPISGIHVNASRSLVTGTYYGSDAKAQLVDNISVGVNVGALLGTTAIEGAWKHIGGNASLGYQRNYTHVRPIMSLESSKNEKWKNLFVPGYMKNLGRILNLPEQEDGTYKDKDVTAGLKEFLAELRDGEVFTITDAYVSQVGVQANIPITALAAGNVGPSIGVGVSGDWAIMKRVTISRRKDRIEVYDNKMNVRSIGANMSLNFWIQVAKVSAQWKKGEAETDVMSMDISPATDDAKVAKADLNGERKKLHAALSQIFVQNEIDAAKDFYPPINVDHELKGKLKRAKVLMWSWSTYEENHKVKVTYPVDPQGRYDAEAEARTLYSSRKVAIKGRDIYGMVGSVISKVSGVEGLLSPSESLNESGTFLGRANWSSVRTEAEVTNSASFKPVMMLEDYYSGTMISKDGLLKIMTHLENEVRSINNDVPVFRKEVFTSTKQLQAYEIRSSIFIYDKGLQELRKFLFAEPCGRGKKCKGLLLRLVDLTDPSDLRKSCRNFLENEVTDTQFEELESLDPKDNRVWRKCIAPWMRKMMRMVRKMPDASNYEDTVSQLNSIVYLMQKHTDLSRFLNRIGKDNFFFQVRVSGFRTKDENGDREYLTDSIGTVQRPVTLGPFADFKVYDLNRPGPDGKYPEWKISDYELQARYFGNGL